MHYDVELNTGNINILIKIQLWYTNIFFCSVYQVNCHCLHYGCDHRHKLPKLGGDWRGGWDQPQRLSEELGHPGATPSRATASLCWKELLRWFGKLFRMHPGRLSLEIQLGRDPMVHPELIELYFSQNYISHLAWKHRRILKEKQESNAGEGDVWNTLLILLPACKQKLIDG